MLEYGIGCSRRRLGFGDALLDVKLTRMFLLLRLLLFLRRATRSSAAAGGKAAPNALTHAWLRAGDLVYDLAKAYAHELICSSVLANFGPSSNLQRFALAAVSENRCEMCQQY